MTSLLDEDVKILIVEDTPPMREALRKILNDIGVSNIIEAEDGRQGLEFYLSESKLPHPFDLIISDINMPNMSGINLLKSIRNFEFGKDVPIIMMTTESEKEIVMDCILAGANDYVVKPYDPALVSEKIIATILARKHSI